MSVRFDLNGQQEHAVMLTALLGFYLDLTVAVQSSSMFTLFYFIRKFFLLVKKNLEYI